VSNHDDAALACGKAAQAAALLDKADIDAWIIIDSGARDAVLPLVAGGYTHDRSIYVFTRDGRRFAVTNWPDKGHVESFGVFDEVIPHERDVRATFRELYDRLAPKRFALNFSPEDALWDGLTHGSYIWLEQAVGTDEVAAKAVPAKQHLEELRSVKNEHEIARLREAMRITLDIYQSVWKQLRVGMTERQIQDLFHSELRERGVPVEDSPLVLLPKAGMAHRQPTDTASAPGDLLVVDFFVQYRGYYSDIARTFYFLRPGETQPPAEYRKAFATIREAIARSFEALRPGVQGFRDHSRGDSQEF